MKNVNVIITGIYYKLTHNCVVFKDRIKAITEIRKHFSVTSDNVFHIPPFKNRSELDQHEEAGSQL